MTIQRRAATRLYEGSAEVARRLGSRVASTTWTARAVGGVMLFKAGPVLLQAAHDQPLLMPAAGCAWCIAAWRVGRPVQQEEQAVEEAVEVNEQESEETLDHDDFLHLLHDLMADTDRIHLAQVAEHLTGDPEQTPAVRNLCAATGVTITRGVRVPGRGVSTGLYRKHLPPLPTPLESGRVAVVVAGQGEQQQQQQQHPAGNAAFTTIADPDNPHRTHVHWVDQPARQAS